MSTNDGQASSQISGSFIELIIRFFNKNFENLTESEKLIIIEGYQHFVRKAAHFSIFAALGFFSAGFLYTYNSLKNIKTPIISVIFVLIYAIFDEVHQMFVPMRSGQLTDVLLDTLGGIFGAVLMNIFLLLIVKFMEAKNEIKK